jgi:hypothetical protein
MKQISQGVAQGQFAEEFYLQGEIRQMTNTNNYRNRVATRDTQGLEGRAFLISSMSATKEVDIPYQ